MPLISTYSMFYPYQHCFNQYPAGAQFDMTQILQCVTTISVVWSCIKWSVDELRSLPVLGRDEPCQFVMFPVRMLFIAPLIKLTGIRLQNSAFLSFC